MYLQEILEVGIGLVFVWLIISVAAMQFQEWVATLFKWRSNNLEAALRSMLAGENAQANQLAGDLIQKLYNHPLIKSLAKDPGKGESRWVGFLNFFRKDKDKIKAGLPSYIPNSKFSLALFDIVMNAGTDESPLKKATEQLDKAFSDANTTLASLQNADLKNNIGEILSQTLEDAKSLAGTPLGDKAVDSIKFAVRSIAGQYPEAKLVTDLLVPQIDQYYNQIVEAQKAADASANTDDEVLKRLRIGIVGLGATSPELMKSLRSLVTGVEGYAAEKEKNLATARKNVETWFDDAMTRLSGSYKRKAQMVAFVIGLLTAILLNIDSINLATMLWREPTLRQAIVAEAQTYVAQNPQGPSASSSDGTATNPAETFANVQKQIKELSIPIGWTTTPVLYNETASCTLSTTTDYTTEKPSIMGLHIKEMCYPIVNALPFTWSNLVGWLTKLLGLLITGAAAAQGAPFWFDILKKLINVRSTGANPSEAKPKG